MERESSKECSAFFLWRKGSFSSRNRPSRNSTLFFSRRSAWSVLKCNHFAKFAGTFCIGLYGQGKLRFWWGISVWIFKCLTDVLYIFLFCAKKKITKCASIWNGFCVEFCHVLSRFYLRERIHDPDSVMRIAFKDLNKNFQETASMSIILSFFIHKINSKHDRYTTASELNLSLMLLTFITRITFAKMSGSVFGLFLIRS